MESISSFHNFTSPANTKCSKGSYNKTPLSRRYGIHSYSWFCCCILSLLALSSQLRFRPLCHHHHDLPVTIDSVGLPNAKSVSDICGVPTSTGSVVACATSFVTPLKPPPCWKLPRITGSNFAWSWLRTSKWSVEICLDWHWIRNITNINRKSARGYNIRRIRERVRMLSYLDIPIFSLYATYAAQSSHSHFFTYGTLGEPCQMLGLWKPH